MPSIGIELSAAGLTGVNISQSKVATIRKSAVDVGGGGLRDVPAFDVHIEQNTLNMYAEKVRMRFWARPLTHSDARPQNRILTRVGVLWADCRWNLAQVIVYADNVTTANVDAVMQYRQRSGVSDHLTQPYDTVIRGTGIDYH